MKCVKLGYDFPYAHSDRKLLCTIFSASGYSGSNNLGAYLSFSREADSEEWERVGYGKNTLFFRAHTYTMNEVEESIEQNNTNSLRSMIMKKRSNILESFGKLDKEKSGKITKDEWAATMVEATGLAIGWLELMPILAIEVDEFGQINYRDFFSHLRSSIAKLSTSENGVIDAIYGMSSPLMHMMFDFFDENGDGIITKDEFQKGCKVLSEKHPDQHIFEDPDHLLKLIDLDGNQFIDKNEFFEVFRLIDALDGKVDGQFDVLHGDNKKQSDSAIE